MDIKDDKDELEKNEIYRLGINEGLRLHGELMEDIIIPILLELYPKMSENDEKNEFDTAIYYISYIYASIFGNQLRFSCQYERGRLLTIPEMKFGRLASPEEKQLPIGDLYKIWYEEEEKEDM